jgi:hypothetical protein
MSRKAWVAVASIGAGLWMMVAPGRADEDTRPLSPAQLALFEADHLRAIADPERLEYRFGHEAEAAGGDFTDTVELDVRPRGDGAKDVWVDFLGGARHQPFPPLMGFRGNPVLMFFLEHDVDEMHRATGGAATYFRNRIRQAFVDRAELRQIELERAGEKEKATEITLTPFEGDARLSAFPGVTEKRYRFVISDQVPGTIYEIGAETPGKAGGKPLLKDTMTFSAVQPCTSAEGPCAPPRLP